VKDLINDITARLLVCYPEDEARALAWWIAEELTGLNRTELQFGCKDTTNFPHLQEKLPEIITRLLHFEPIQYIFGHTLWNGLDLKLSPATLIPRPETAELTERINSRLRNDEYPTASLLDIGTGSGCIAISLKKAHPAWRVSGIDISPEAIAISRENALKNKADVNFQVADIFSEETVNESWADGRCYDIVVSNPPYICESEKTSMKPNVLDYEPASALFVPDDDPLRFYRRICSLHIGKYIFFEINEGFAEEMKELLEKEKYTDIQITNDLYGKARIIEGRMA